MTVIVSVNGLNKTFGRKPVLRELDFELESGRIIGLMGPNGAGKTTLIKTLMNIYHADSGQIWICGEPVSQGTKGLISYMPDKNHLYSWMRVRDAIHYYTDMFGDFNAVRAKELCSSLRIDESEKVRALSKGFLERLLIMLTLSRNSRLYLLDEPIGGIDPLEKELVLKTILSGLNEDSTILLATHLIKDVETVIDDVMFIHEGKLIFSDTAENIREKRSQSIEECYLEVLKNA